MRRRGGSGGSANTLLAALLVVLVVVVMVVILTRSPSSSAASVAAESKLARDRLEKLVEESKQLARNVELKLERLSKQESEMMDLQRRVADLSAQLLSRQNQMQPVDSAHRLKLRSEIQSVRKQLKQMQKQKREREKQAIAMARVRLELEKKQKKQGSPVGRTPHKVGTKTGMPLSVYSEWSTRKYQVHPKRRDGSIFVSLATFRDPLCPNTLTSVFKQAKFPDKIFVGIVQQNLPADLDCLEAHCEAVGQDNCRRDQVEVIRMSPKQSKGVTHVRWLATTQMKGEDYFMQVDSHTDFIKHWDAKVIGELLKLPYERVVLSAHPPAVGQDMTGATVNLCDYTWQLGMPRFQGQHFKVTWAKVRGPFPGMFFGAGFVFSRSEMVDEVPYDPHLEYTFQGEELLYSVRLWTKGWDIWSPTFPIVYHHYQRPVYDRAVGNNQPALHRILFLLGLARREEVADDHATELKEYGMGSERTVASYWSYANIHPDIRDRPSSWCDVRKVVSSMATQHHGWKPDYAWLPRDRWITEPINWDNNEVCAVECTPPSANRERDPAP